MKILIVLLLLLSVGCAATTSPNSSALISSSTQSDQQQITSSSVASSISSSSSTTALLELTLEELKQFDGKSGRKAYIAVEGIIYDVSGNLNWFRGNHNGVEAGRDLTLEIDTLSPHGRSKLLDVPKVGRIKR
jgi:predicted heme/steroid binding protein